MFEQKLTDSELLLAFCIYEEGLANPADFTARFRTAIQKMGQIPANDAEASEWEAEWDRLREEIDVAKRMLALVRLDNTEAKTLIESILH